MPPGARIVFTPAYPASLTLVVQNWLDFPTSATGAPSSQSYKPTDDMTQLWPNLVATLPAATLSAALLNLVLCVLTEGFITPPPSGIALGDVITTTLLGAPPTTARLASVSATDWTKFFGANPTFLPPGTGDLSERIVAFIRRVQTFFSVTGGAPSASFTLTTTTATAAGR